jgi:hypothetical protein
MKRATRTQNKKIHNRKTKKTIEMSNTELRIYRYTTGQHKKTKEMSNTELRTYRYITGQHKKTKEMSNTELRT